MARKQDQHSESHLVVSQALLNALALGYDFENRCIYLFGPIDQMVAYRFVAGFKWLDRTPGPIHVILNSEGGETDAGMAIYEALRTAQNPILIEAMGTVASAAVPVLLAGTVRFLNPETYVMIHNVSWHIEGGLGTPQMRSMAKIGDAINKRYYEIIAERTGKSLKDVEKWCDDETYFNSTEAVKHGFADKIVDVRELPKSFKDGIEELNGAKANRVASKPEVHDPPRSRRGRRKASAKKR